MLCLVPFLLLPAVAVAGGDTLTTFIVHVQPPEPAENQQTAGDREAWYRSFLPEDGRLVHAYHHVASGFVARLTREELDALSAMPGFVAAVPEETYEMQIGMKTDRIRTDITDITFVFIFLSGFGFEYG